MSSVDVARFHRYQVFDEFVGRIHGFLEEANDHCVELLFQLRISSEERFRQELSQYSHQLIVH